MAWSWIRLVSLASKVGGYLETLSCLLYTLGGCVGLMVSCVSGCRGSCCGTDAGTSATGAGDLTTGATAEVTGASDSGVIGAKVVAVVTEVTERGEI
ncbi:hypothetical protein F5Y08DRAFT_89346 [Xylaria arbuscula]|nr:hypothetical protein F5Y08DRAFT_89346 [Xylaria arbuscula]